MLEGAKRAFGSTAVRQRFGVSGIVTKYFSTVVLYFATEQY